MSWGLDEELYGLIPWGADWEPSNLLDLSENFFSFEFYGTGGGDRGLFFNLPEFEFHFESGGSLAFDFQLSVQISNEFISYGLLDIAHPEFDFNLHSYIYTAGQLVFNHPEFDFSLHGAEMPTGSFDIDFLYEIGIISSYASHLALLYNLNTMQGPFQFSNYNFDSIMYHNGSMYLANASGLYKVEGLKDISTNIDATLVIAEDDFGDENLKSIADIYIGMQGGPLLVQTFHDASYSSQLTLVTASDFVTRRAKHPRGDKHRYWGVKLVNSSGASATIDKIIIPIASLSRKISQ